MDIQIKTHSRIYVRISRKKRIEFKMHKGYNKISVKRMGKIGTLYFTLRLLHLHSATGEWGDPEEIEKLREW